MTKNTLTKIAALTLSIGLLGGCAGQQTQAEIDAQKAAVGKAQQTADAALKAAQQAQATADEADRKAKAAMDAANAAQAAADESAERTNRAMRKAMQK